MGFGRDAMTDDTFEVIKGRLGTTPHLELGWDGRNGSLWLGFAPTPRPCFTAELVTSIRRVGDVLRGLREEDARGDAARVSVVVFGSTTPGYFSTGGDLSLIVGALEARDARGLEDYAQGAMVACHAMATGFGADVLTVAMVDGQALGSGFEAARCCDVVVATTASRFQLPEVQFGLHPGHGAMSVMSARTTFGTMRRLVVEGEALSAEEAAAAGLVDHLVPDGETIRSATTRVVGNLRHRLRAALALSRGWHDARGLSYDAMRAETDRWVASALALTEQQVERMRRIVTAQNRQFRVSRQTAAAGETAACR